ncbi:MAG: flagellar assembly protein FliW [Candidatus Marinimicrobia bacterium]|jgi:flagellar assembly factor FliW|nr:flagellar assembly protein FliW [Candidatus Neomarinimicrobiota bacterium]HJM47445.1 flagellar assembly protein FliW [Candidatus Neomarinimicrobiota bacterium]|tara:strand:+ start:1002 stop:1490 length:489 start_codon:yes stop_codon:yes gene_type:complete
MKTTVATHTSQTDSFLCRFHSGEYQMLNGNGTDFDLTNIIDFDNGIPGFEELSKFIVVPLIEHHPFQVLQSLEAPPIAMFVIPIHHFESKQEIKIERIDLEQIGVRSQDETDIYFVMKMSQEEKIFTVNTKAPIVINPKILQGCQVILDNPNLQIEQPLDLA